MKENTPSPLFNPRVQLQNLSKSIGNVNVSPPRSPQQSKNHSFTEDKEPTTSTIKKITQSHLKNTLLHSIQLNNNSPNTVIPQFYFPKGKAIDEQFINQQLVLTLLLLLLLLLFYFHSFKYLINTLIIYLIIYICSTLFCRKQ